MKKCLKEMFANSYPKLENAVWANENKVVVTTSLALPANHVDLDSPSYLEKKFKKSVPALESITVMDGEHGGKVIVVTMSISSKFNSVSDIDTLAVMGETIVKIAEDRLSESQVINAIGADCTPWFKDEHEKKSN